MFIKKLTSVNFQLFKDSIKSIINYSLPPTCILCGFRTHSAQNICTTCHKSLPILSHNCERCAQSLPLTTQICGHCLKNPPPFDAIFALFLYEAPIIQLIIELKFQNKLTHAKLLGELLAKKISYDWYKNRSLPNLIIPMPLHANRLRERGFNQALEIARPIAKLLNLPIDIDNAKRCKPTRAQSGLSALERKKNVRNAFVCYKNYAGSTIAVIDDVVTTTQTITEFCRILKKQNASSIHVWCCARRDIALKVKKL